MKNQKGITLVSLVVTIILLFVLASITTSAGLDSYRTMQVQTFVAKMKVLQSKTSQIRADYKNWKPEAGQDDSIHTYCADVLHFTSVTALPENDQKAFNRIIAAISATNPTSWSKEDDVLTNYFYFDEDSIQTKLGLKNVDKLSVIINFETGNIIDRYGVINPKKKNSRIYRQYDYSGGDQLINGKTPNLAYVDDSQTIVDYVEDTGAGGVTGGSGISVNEKYTSEGLLINETKFTNDGFMLRVYLTQNHGDMQRFKMALLSLEGNTTSVNIQTLKYMADNTGRASWTEATGDERVANITYNLNEVTFDVKVTDLYSFGIETSNFDTLAINGKIDVTLVNPPKLAAGMIPVYWKAQEDDSGLITNTEIELTQAETTSPYWYNYSKDEKHWANAKTADGSYWVWIPRFSYLYDTNAESIDIKFLQQLTETPYDAQTNNYNIHPSFTYQTAIGTNTKIYPAGQWDSDLSGYWIAKYDAGMSVTRTTQTVQKPVYKKDRRGNIQYDRWGRPIVDHYETVTETVTSEALKFAPGARLEDKHTYEEVVQSCNDLKNTISSSSNNLNTHLMRNSEWGAVSYLTWSKYGSKYVANNSSIFSSGMNIEDKQDPNDFYAEIYSASKYLGMTTTGNPFGLYDMVGGVNNMVSAMTYERLTTKSTRAITLYSFVRRENRIPGDGMYEVTKSESGNGETTYLTWGGYQADYPTPSMIILRGGDRENTLKKNGIFSYNYMPFSIQQSVFENVGYRAGLIVN